MTTSRALCSRSASCIGPINAARQRRLSAAFLTGIPESARQVHDDAFANAFNTRKPSGFAPPAKSSASQSPSQKPSRWQQDPLDAPRRPPQNSRFAKKPEEEKESAMDIFKSVVSSKKTDETSKEGHIADYSLRAVLRQVSKQDMAPRKRVDFFHNDVWPQVVAQGRPLNKHLLGEVNEALKSVSNTLLTEPGFKQIQAGDLANLAKAYQWLGTNDVSAISGLIVGLCFLIHNPPTSRPSRVSNRGAQAMPAATVRNPELMTLWKHLSSMNRAGYHFDTEEDRLELRLPAPDDVARITAKLDSPAGVDVALTSILNQFPARTAMEAFPALTATLTVLLHYAPAGILPQWAPLLDPMRHLMKAFRLGDGKVKRQFADITLIPPISQSIISRAVVRRWSETYDMLTSDRPVWHSSYGQPSTRRKYKVHLTRLNKDLRAAHETHNPGLLPGLWKEVQSFLAKSDGSLEEEMRQNPEYLNYWHFVWCASKQSHMIPETQALMQRLGLEPTIKTYTAMMHGWKLSRQTDKLSMLWDGLRTAEYQLDSYMWTERISGLIELRELQKGINTLGEMLSLWKKAVEEGNGDKAVPVTISVVNAAFKPLIRKDRKAAFKILQWAGDEGIRPDIVTYNVLLRECFRKTGSTDDVTNLLMAMKNEGIEPDGATFTIILEGACRDLNFAPADAQVVAVNQVIQDMKTANVPLNLEIWGKLLHTVTSIPNGSTAAVECVLQHARDAGYEQISPHMVHTLIKRIVQNGEGNPAAVEDLLLKNGYEDTTSGDQRLWEEVISTYSTMGDGKRAMAVYNDLRRTGRKLSRQFAARDFLTALLNAGEREVAQILVDETLEGARGEEVNDRFFKHNFWNRAYNEGMLDWDKAPLALKKALDPPKAALRAMPGGTEM